jgi:transcriptional regulator with GAF, ATPase, and Fis domain
MTENYPPIDELDELSFRSYAMFVQTKLMSSIFDLDKLVEISIDAFVELMRVDVGFIMLFNEKTQQLSVEAVKGLKRHTIGKTRINIDRDIIQGIIERKAPIFLSELEETLPMKLLFQEMAEKVGGDIVLSIPLLIKKNLIGLLNLGRRELEAPFKQADLQFLYTLADHVAIAIENANLYRELEAKVEERTKNLKERTEKLERINRLFVDRELRMKEMKEEIKELKSKMQEEGRS